MKILGRRRMTKAGAGLLLVGATVFSGAGTAWAAMSGGIPTLSATGVSFTSGSWRFDPWPCTSACQSGTWSGWNYSGQLNDTLNDYHDPFAHARIDGYGWGTRVYWKGGPGTGTSFGQKVYAANPAQQGQLEVCDDRGTLVPDTCAASPWYRR